MSMLKASVVICTHNRATILRDTLQSLARQTISDSQFEILVVDNASADATPATVEAFATTTTIPVRYLQEPQLGIAIARNRGWREAAGPLIVYVDDDAEADADWLETILTTFETVIPTPACVTGLVELNWVGGRPSWFPERYDSLIARYDLGPDAKWLTADGYLVTCNAAFQRAAIQEVGGFREGLGHRGRERHGGEDNEMFTRLVARGQGIYYQPRARVRHLTPKDRQTRRYLLERMMATGVSQVGVDVLTNQRSRADLRRNFFYDARMLLVYGIRWLGSLVRGDTVQGWDNLFGLSQKLGRLRAELALMGWPLTVGDAERNALWQPAGAPKD